jgi:hypothetical protein
MKTTLKILAVLLVVLTFLPYIGTAADTKYSGFLGDNYQLLEPGPKDGLKMRYLKPGVNFGKYSKLMIDQVTFFFADDSEYKGIDPTEMKQLADEFNQKLNDVLQPLCPIVLEPGPDVARIKIAITNVKHNKPAYSVVTSIIPVGLAISAVKKGTTGSWSGSGSTSSEMMILDSSTDDIIALGVDDRKAGFTDRFSKWGSASEAFDFWAKRIALFINSTKKQQQDELQLQK